MKTIVVVGYPSSGTSWLCRLLACILECELPGYFDGKRIINEKTGETCEHDIKNTEYQVLKSHVVYNKAMIDPLDYKFIYLVRNPKDVVCSYGRFFRMEFDRSLRRMARPHHGATWQDHVLGWINHNHWIKYEDLIEDTELILNKILSVNNIEYNKDRLRECIAFHQIEKEKKRKKTIRNINFGIINKYKEELSKEEIQDVEKCFGDAIKELKYD